VTGYSGVRRRTLSDVEKTLWVHPDIPFGLVRRELNRDDETGAATLVVDVPPGWSMPGSANSSPLEMLVLDGSIVCGTRELARGHYTFLPTGSPFADISTDNGATILLWHDGAVAALPEAQWDRSAVVQETVDVFDPANWVGLREAFAHIDTSSHNRVIGRALCIRLRTFEETGGDTVLFMMAKGFRKLDLEVHESAEEVVTLSGILTTDPEHVYEPGEYFCWEPNVVHGPVTGWDAVCISKHRGQFTSASVEIAGP